MKQAVSSAVLCLVILTGVSCVSTNATMLGDPTTRAGRTPVSPDIVAVYRTADQVPRTYDEVALLHSAGDSGMTNEPKMIRSMQVKAASLGANAIILDAISEPSAGAKIAAALFLSSAQRKGKAIAIYVHPASAQ